RRICRLADAYLNFSGANSSKVVRGDTTTNIQSSCFLRPYMRRLQFLEGLRLGRITRAMTTAARHGETFHLWWHPHNFGANRPENIQALCHVLDHFEKLRDEFGMASMAMEDFAD
ncbi:MAG: hypothetical protein OER56_12160, partial [Hyphomicrobiales bacterium]|nr:hypothetical protein [Hyphomicrobiales bacterium]